jgi:hypothetical protein
LEIDENIPSVSININLIKKAIENIKILIKLKKENNVLNIKDISNNLKVELTEKNSTAINENLDIKETKDIKELLNENLDIEETKDINELNNQETKDINELNNSTINNLDKMSFNNTNFINKYNCSIISPIKSFGEKKNYHTTSYLYNEKKIINSKIEDNNNLIENKNINLEPNKDKINYLLKIKDIINNSNYSPIQK